jgi:DNA-binding response OmpR family regulator
MWNLYFMFKNFFFKVYYNDIISNIKLKKLICLYEGELSMSQKLIYIVDDEERIRNLISSYLKKENYLVETFPDGQDALDAFIKKPSDMLIIDIMMPNMDGYTLCREIRKSSDIPIIMVSAKDEEIDRILGLELGSDDYIAKPFSPRELVVRVKNIFKRTGVQTKEIVADTDIKVNDLIISFDKRTVCKDGIEIDITTKEFDLIKYLLENKNIAFNREQLIKELWGYDYYGDSRSIDDLVKRIRKKLSKANSVFDIQTVWGYGYKITV